jgi:hypothetical protein
MTRTRIEVQLVDTFQLGNLTLRLGGERRPALKRVQHDAFEQISKGHIPILGERLQNLEEAPLDANAGLNAFNG